MVKGATVGSILDDNRGEGPGFSILRLALSAAVVFFHSHNAAYGPDHLQYFTEGWANPFVAVVLAMFFGLSGFLVAGSALRTGNVIKFSVARTLRIVPALMVEVTLSALILGPLVTTVSMRRYFSDYHLYGYFGNIIGRIRFELPGVFTGLPTDGIVNRSLWTIHPELECYAVMALLMITGIVFKRKISLILWSVATFLLVAIDCGTTMFELRGVFDGPVLVYYFVTGIIVFHWRYFLPVNGYIFILSALTSYVLLRTPHTVFIVPVFILYMTVWIGMQTLPTFALTQTGRDYSYGIYLYSFPIQQSIVFFWPAAREWWIIFPLALLFSLGVAALSWHWIEKPALKLKTAFTR